MVGAVVHGATPISKKGRQAEIEYYIKRNGIKQYIVLDDDPSLFDDLSRITFYKPDYRNGLTKQDVKRICRELKEHDRRNISK